MGKLNLLYVEDDIRYFENFKLSVVEMAEVTLAKNELDTVSLLKSYSYDAILVDLNIADSSDGVFLAREIIANYGIPVVFLTSDTSLNSKIQCLKIGVSDYLWKTMEIEEIKIRILNAVKNYKKADSSSGLEMANLKLNLNESAVILDGCRIEISSIELRLLSNLLSIHPQSVDRKLILEKTWFTINVSSGAVSTAIYQLNKKLLSWKYKIISMKGSEFGLVLKSQN